MTREEHLVVRSLFLLVTLLLCSSTVLAETDKNISDTEVIEYLNKDLPPFWKVNKLISLRINAPTSNRVIVKVDAELEVKEELFVTIDKAGPFDLVVKTSKPGQKIETNATVDLVKRQNKWVSGVNFRTTLDTFGIPLKRFSAPTLEIGSEEAKATLLRITDVSLQKQQSELQSTVDKQLTILETEARARIANARKKLEESYLQQQQVGAAELLELVTKHSIKRGELIAKQTQEISELETGFAVKRASILRQLKTSKEITKNQELVLENLRTLGNQEAEMLSQFNQLQATRKQQLEQLPSVWRGASVCKSSENDQYENGLVFKVSEVQSNGLSGLIWINNAAGAQKGQGGYEAQIVLLSEALDFPLQLRFVSQQLSRLRNPIPAAFELSLSINGKMIGSRTMKVRVGGKQTELDCQVQFSG